MAVQAAAIDLFVGTSVPLILAVMLTRFFDPGRSWRAGLRAWRFALFAGLSFTLPALGAAVLLGPEFPSILGALVGLAVVIPVARKGLMLPGSAPPRAADNPTAGAPVPPRMPLRRAWAPYLLLAALLVASRIEFRPLKAWLEAATVSWTGIPGTEIGVSIAPLYLPGAMFLAIVLVTIPLHRMSSPKPAPPLWGPPWR